MRSKPDDPGSPKRKETLTFNTKERRGAGSPVGVLGCFSQAKVSLRCELWNVQERCQVLVHVGDCESHGLLGPSGPKTEQGGKALLPQTAPPPPPPPRLFLEGAEIKMDGEVHNCQSSV